MAEKKKITAFAVRLRKLREAAGLTQAELAERANMHLHGLTKLEHGDREPSWATVQALSAALGVDCTAFQVNDSSSLPSEEEQEKRPRGRPRKTEGDKPKKGK